MNSDREKYKAYALSVSEKWSLEELRSAFVAEYVDRRMHDDKWIKLWDRTLTLRGKIGALGKKIKKLKQGNIAKARAIPLRNCDLFGGDPGRLHKLWWEWSGDPKNCNADGTVKFTFGEWLLMPADAKGGAE